jgi:LPS-assembly protein
MAQYRLLPLTVALTIAGVCLADDTSLCIDPTESTTNNAVQFHTRQGPVFFDADTVSGQQEDHILAEGNVCVRTQEDTIRADWLRYDPNTDIADAKGKVQLQHGGNRLDTDRLHLKVTDRVGEAEPAHFTLVGPKGLPARADASKLHFEGPNQYRLEESSFTSCPVNNDDWYLRSSDLNLDFDHSIGKAHHVRVEYLGVPILYAPAIDFSLNDNRKSGFLSPSIGVSDKRGLEVIAPWYWNIAPNQDATFSPRFMTSRGTQLGMEYRYLEPGYQGTLEVEAMPHDSQTGTGRYRELFDHKQQFSPTLSGTVHVEDVSDDTYFTDLSSLVSQTAIQNLPREATLSYNGGWWNVLGRVQAYQTLQDPAAPIPLPYRRLPQIVLNADKDYLHNGLLHFNFAGELVRFDHDQNSMATGDRFNAYPSLAMNLERSYGYIRPKLGWELTQYHLDRNPSYPDTLSATRSLPIFSLDSGVYLDRNMNWRGNAYLQTLEPRLYYVRIPYRDQTDLPVFDSGMGDPLQPQLYTENQFIGVDRINDANQLTVGVTSRFMEADSGLERLQVTLGQRFYFKEQQVVMPGYSARGSNVTNLLGLVSGQLTERVRIRSGFQYNSQDHQLAQASLGGAYQPAPGKLINAEYRYTNSLYGTVLNPYGTAVNQIDLSWQWPIKSKWYSLGRFNYSVHDHRLTDGLVGLEYNAGCWSLRTVMQKLVTTAQTSSNIFFLQLELRGLTRLGPNPLDVLKHSIPGYTKSDELE